MTHLLRLRRFHRSIVALFAVCITTATLTWQPLVSASSEFTPVVIRSNTIVMQLNNPQMTLNGIPREVDSGRNTAPLIIDDYTMVPIRAVIEAMGGSAFWDSGEQKILLEALGHRVEMWLNKVDLSSIAHRRQ